MGFFGNSTTNHILPGSGGRFSGAGLWEHLSYYRDLVWVLTKKELKIRYKNSVLGYVWSVLNPLAFAAVFYFAFRMIMKVGIEDYPVFLISTLFPWQWFSNSVGSAPMLFLSNASIIKKTTFPKSALVLAASLHDMIHFALSVPIILMFLLIYHRVPTWAWMYDLPILLLVQLLLTTGVSLFLATMNLFFRDMERLTNTGMILLFYCTPILYSEDLIPEAYRSWAHLNPLAPLMACWRGLFFHGEAPLPILLLSVLQAVLVFGLGYLVFKRLSWRFAEVL